MLINSLVGWRIILYLCNALRRVIQSIEKIEYHVFVRHY